MGCMFSCCTCCRPQKQEEEPYRSLRSAQTMIRTKSGKPVNQTVHNRFHNRTELETWKTTLSKKDRRWKEVFKKPMNDFTQITDNLFLTGMGGICEENIRGENIKCIVNVTNELAKYVIEGIESIRIPIRDSTSVDIYHYFTDLSNKIQENSNNHRNTVVYCMGGGSRSATLVMAYLMKHKKMHLKEAFIYVLKKRPVSIPNRHFLRSLREYEKEIYKKNFNQTIDFYENKNKITVPDFTAKYFIHNSSGTDTDRSDSLDDSLDLTSLLVTYQDI